MLKKRLIFTLLVQKGRFMLSRNFTLQAAGDLDWIMEHYEFDSIAFSIDELIVLNVDRDTSDTEQFCGILAKISAHCFMPIAAGGRIRCIEDADRLFKSGADKVVINSPLFQNHGLIRDLVARFGSQSVIASIDYKRAQSSSEGEVFVENGSRPVGMTLSEAVPHALELGAGELYLTSITRDGTGQGLDTEYISRIGEGVSVPVIISGGAGNFRHLSDAISLKSISAVSTANLFNFMSDNLTEAREEIIASGTALATWEKIVRNADHE
jgi:cyclase